MTPSVPKDEIRALTGIRGIAALMVVLYHFHDSFVTLLPAWRVFAPTAKVGLLGVDLFFVLSGLILCHVYEADARPVTWESHARFLGMRLARVHPNVVATVVAMMFVCGLAQALDAPLGGLYPAEQLPLHLAMTHAWFRSPGQEWNYPSWSVSTEWFAYLFLFPLGAWLLRRRLPVLLHLAGALALTQTWLYIANGTWPHALFPILRIVCGFMAGVSLYAVWRGWPQLVALCRRHATWLLVGFVVTVMVLPAFLARAPDLMMILMPLLLLGLTADGSWAARALGGGPLLHLGRLSYALYMSHAVVERALELFVPVARFAQADPAVRIGVLALYGVALYAGASLLYHGVEEPGRAWLRALDRPRKRAVLPA